LSPEVVKRVSRPPGRPTATRMPLNTASAGTRHTAASLMIQAGYPPKMLQEIMGHASITTTLDLYGHLYPGEMDRYADRLNEAAAMTDPADDAAKMRPDDDLDEDEDE
jgi:integrase